MNEGNEGKEERHQICIFKIFFSLKATSVILDVHVIASSSMEVFVFLATLHIFSHSSPTSYIVSSNILLAVSLTSKIYSDYSATLIILNVEFVTRIFFMLRCSSYCIYFAFLIKKTCSI